MNSIDAITHNTLNYLHGPREALRHYLKLGGDYSRLLSPENYEGDDDIAENAAALRNAWQDYTDKERAVLDALSKSGMSQTLQDALKYYDMPLYPPRSFTEAGRNISHTDGSNFIRLRFEALDRFGAYLYRQGVITDEIPHHRKPTGSPVMSINFDVYLYGGDDDETL